MIEYGSYLVHSAKGTTWTKRDHKYIKKIDGVYYYATDRQMARIESRNSKIEENETNAEKSESEAEDHKNRSEVYDDYATYYKKQAKGTNHMFDRVARENAKKVYEQMKSESEKEKKASKKSSEEADAYREKADKYKKINNQYTLFGTIKRIPKNTINAGKRFLKSMGII